MRVAVVTGSRTWEDEGRLTSTLEAFGPDMVVHGGARGADVMAGRWALKHGKQVRVFPAQWNAHGRSAGFKRNQTMVEWAVMKEAAGDDVLVMGFWRNESPGTADMIGRSKRHGLDVYVEEAE